MFQPRRNPNPFGQPFAVARQAYGSSIISIASLVRWYEADHGVWSDTAGTTPAAADGSVQRWDDRSNNAAHATQATASLLPTLRSAGLNGRAGLEFASNFSSTRDQLNFTSITLSNFTVFLVYSAPNFGVASYIIGNANSGIVSGATYTNPDAGAFAVASLNIRGSTNTSTAPRLVSHTNSSVRYGGVDATYLGSWGVGESNAPVAGLILDRIGGRGVSGLDFNGILSAILVFNENLSNANMNIVGQYLADKYSFTWTNV